jgi:carboxymethylenebutenolidase
MPTVPTERVRLPISDGTEMSVYLARPAGGGRHPGLLVFQEAYGVNAHIRDVTERFAREGYVAAAPELYHRTAPGFEGVYTDFEAVRGHMAAMTQEGLAADLRAAYDRLASDSSVEPGKIGAAGFCMGGRVAYIANALLPLRAASSFYGGGIAPALLDRAPSLNAPMLLVWGGLDKHIPAEQRSAVAEALRAAGKDFIEAVFSQADHGFFCDVRASYHAPSARIAWPLLLAFLREQLGAARASASSA